MIGTRTRYSLAQFLEHDLCRTRTGRTAPFLCMPEILCAEFRFPESHVSAAARHLQNTILAVSSSKVFPALSIEIDGEKFLIA